MEFTSDFVCSTITYWGWEQAKEQVGEQARVQASGHAGGHAGGQASGQAGDQAMVQATQVKRLVKAMWNIVKRRYSGDIPSWA